MSELSVGTLSGLAANSYEIDIASGSTLDLANAKAGSLPESALAFTAGGLKHITTNSFTSVASVSLDNVFSATYQNYRVVIGSLQGSTNVALWLRYRASGVDTSANYKYVLYGNRTTNSLFNDYNNSGNINQRIGSVTTTASQNKVSFDVFDPFVAEITGNSGGSFGGDASSYYGVLIAGAQTDAISFDGFRIFLESGTFSGVVSVYGYVEA